jgi:phosphosulfolactate phosphohydrolase-like enzyme
VIVARPRFDKSALRAATVRMSLLEAEARGIVVVLTAEQAIKAQRVVREAGRKRGT